MGENWPVKGIVTTLGEWVEYREGCGPLFKQHWIGCCGGFKASVQGELQG